MVIKGQELFADGTNTWDFNQHSKIMVDKKSETFYFIKGNTIPHGSRQHI
jgi:hypothetical protein